MQLFTARQAWHDAFDPGLTTISIPLLSTAQGRSLDRTHGLMLKGMVQSVVHKIQKKDLVAYTWGMYAYAPLANYHRIPLGPLHRWLDEEILREYPTLKKNRVAMNKTKLLRFVAMRDAAQIDWSQKTKRRRFEALGNLIGVDAEQYKKDWHKYYLFLRCRCLDLPARSLPQVAHFVVLWKEREESDMPPGRWAKELSNLVSQE